MGWTKPIKTAWPEGAPTRAKEKRREERFLTGGEVRLFLEDPAPMEIKGRLLDYSNGGFRAAHGHRVLQAGQEVRFRHFRAQGKARVVWNRILPKRMESGFLILE